MKVIIASGGRFHSHHLAHQLAKRNALEKIFTFSYTKSDEQYVLPNFVSNNNFLGSLDFIFSKLRLSKFLNRSEFNFFKDNLFDIWLSKQLKAEVQADIFVGWAGYFLKSLSQLRKIGAKIIVECGSTHICEQDELLRQEYEYFGLRYLPILQKNINKVLAEYEQSDYIMTCSNFTQQSFFKRGIKKEKVLKIPYGVNLDFFLAKKDQQQKRDDKFRVICVGLMCLRKGIPYLLQAWEKLGLPENKAELLLVGNLQKDLMHVLKNMYMPKNVNFYGPTDRETLANLYKSSDLFVLPSIEEGLSMTIAEAMACKLPVVCTKNTGGEELVENGHEGFIIPIRNSDILAEKILWCYQNREGAKNMGDLGHEKVKSFTWDVYGQKVFEVYKSILSSR
jgi:glycosyltransferase involved in cell wall biosynthesis